VASIGTLKTDRINPNPMMIQANELVYSYPTGGFSLRLPELSIEHGETVAITGPSGSGKTTLLNIIAGILRPDHGSLVVDGTELTSIDDRAARNFRVSRIGLIFQEFELLEYLTVMDNILLPYRINRQLSLAPEVRARTTELTGRTGISDKLNRFPEQLSQGERQRVAVCRALVTQPTLLLADEPTGNLDPENKLAVRDLLLEMAREQNATLITVTHDHDLVAHFDRTLDFAELNHASKAAA
jgi:putative ABC transport system ATP-binding protein